MSSQPFALFPKFTPSYILAFQFSSWYPQFANLSIKSTIIRPLTQPFCDYLDADGVFVPEGSEDMSVYANVQAQPLIMTIFLDLSKVHCLTMRMMRMPTMRVPNNPQNAFRSPNSTQKSGIA